MLASWFFMEEREDLPQAFYLLFCLLQVFGESPLKFVIFCGLG
jgi:hypothetical protein